MNLKTLALHPFLFVAFQILSIYSINVNEATFSVFVAILIIALSVVGLLFFSFQKIVKDPLRLTLVLSSNIFLFFIYGRVYNWLLEASLFGMNLGRNKFLLPIFALLMISITVAFLRSNKIGKSLENLNYYLNYISITLVSVTLVSSISAFDWHSLGDKPSLQDTGMTLENDGVTENVVVNDLAHPNIYFMIFDSYMSHRTLLEYYDWDDSLVINSLEEKGFRVDRNARSNYCFTGASIGSTLDMRYLHEDSLFKSSNNNTNYIGQYYYKNKVMERLTSEGYEIVSNIGSHSFTKIDDKSSFFSDDFFYLVVHVSMLRIIENELVTQRLRSQITSAFEGLKNLKKPDRPMFLFMHVTAPHAPFVFNADGSKPLFFESAFTKYEDRHKYIEQVKYVGGEMLEIVDNIKSQDPNSIIIVTSDHGYGGSRDHIYLNRFSEAAMSDNHELSAPADYLDGRFGILRAISLPDNVDIPEQSTPVNFFKYVFHSIFGDPLETLSDRSFFTVIKQPYVFHDVTEIIK
jgi:hypothetical protein